MELDKDCVNHTLRYLAELVKVEDGGNFSADLRQTRPSWDDGESDSLGSRLGSEIWVPFPL